MWTSKTRSKKAAEKKRKRAARKGSPSQLRRAFKIGDRVRVIDVSADLKDAGYDKTSAAAREMRTAELFEFCVGREFEIRGFQKGFVELEVSRDPSVRRKFGNGHTIWIEPQFLQRLAGKKRL